jgi:hypothetical protein
VYANGNAHSKSQLSMLAILSDTERRIFGRARKIVVN